MDDRSHGAGVIPVWHWLLVSSVLALWVFGHCQQVDSGRRSRASAPHDTTFSAPFVISCSKWLGPKSRRRIRLEALHLTPSQNRRCCLQQEAFRRTSPPQSRRHSDLWSAGTCHRFPSTATFSCSERNIPCVPTSHRLPCAVGIKHQIPDGPPITSTSFASKCYHPPDPSVRLSGTLRKIP